MVTAPRLQPEPALILVQAHRPDAERSALPFPDPECKQELWARQPLATENGWCRFQNRPTPSLRPSVAPPRVLDPPSQFQNRIRHRLPEN